MPGGGGGGASSLVSDSRDTDMDVPLIGCTTVVLCDRYETGLGEGRQKAHKRPLAYAEENWTSMRHMEPWVIHVCIAKVTAMVVH